MRHVEVTKNRNPSFRLCAVLNFISTSRMREHAQHKSNRISEYLRRREMLRSNKAFRYTLRFHWPK